MSRRTASRLADNTAGEQRQPHPTVQRLVRQVGADDAPPAELARRVEEAVRAGVVVEFIQDHPVGPLRVAFRVQLGRGTLQVVDGRGRHVGTFASIAAAIAHGWAAMRQL